MLSLYCLCVFFILAKDPDKTIYLEFESLDTECSYDFLFIYDGNTFKAPLLASLSGKNKPDPVLARSGKVSFILC